MPKRKYVSWQEYEELHKKLKKIEEQVLHKKRRRRRVRVITSSSSDDNSYARRSQRDDRPLSEFSADPAQGTSRKGSTPPCMYDGGISPENLAASPPVSPAPGIDDNAAPASATAPAPSAPSASAECPAAASHAVISADAIIGEVPSGILDAQELDADILKILGIDPTKTEKFGKAIHNLLAVRFEHTATTGLSKEDRKDLIDKYLVPENCKMIGAPALNPETKAALSEMILKRDTVIESKQKLMASSISSLGQAITLVMSYKEKNAELLRLLMDTAKTLCDCQYQESVVRRNFITFSIKKDMKESLQNTKIDTFLFGSNLTETLKTAKAINKQGAELKLPPAPKPSTSRTNPSKNWKGQGQANQARPQAATTSKTMTSKRTATANKEPRASSSKRSQPHRSSHNRR